MDFCTTLNAQIPSTIRQPSTTEKTIENDKIDHRSNYANSKLCYMYQLINENSRLFFEPSSVVEPNSEASIPPVC